MVAGVLNPVKRAGGGQWGRRRAGSSLSRSLLTYLFLCASTTEWDHTCREKRRVRMYIVK